MFSCLFGFVRLAFMYVGVSSGTFKNPRTKRTKRKEADNYAASRFSAQKYLFSGIEKNPVSEIFFDHFGGTQIEMFSRDKSPTYLRLELSSCPDSNAATITCCSARLLFTTQSVDGAL
jgi:hypothetical protein